MYLVYYANAMACCVCFHGDISAAFRSQYRFKPAHLKPKPTCALWMTQAVALMITLVLHHKHASCWAAAVTSFC